VIVVPPSQITGRRKAEYLHTHFYLNSYEESEVKLLDEMWLKPIVHVGELVSGDEKVFHFTGNHMNTKAVKQKLRFNKTLSFLSLYLHSNFLFLIGWTMVNSSRGVRPS
jgi:hypothetical protein